MRRERVPVRPAFVTTVRRGTFEGMPDAPKSFTLSPEVHRYLLAHGSQPDDVQQGLIERTHEAAKDFAGMQIAPEQGAFMTMVTRLIGARQAVEVGTFTGYSALCIARGLAEGGRLICCDISEEWTSIGRPYWEKAGVADRIDLRIGPAADTLAALPAGEQFDLAFIDADKPGYIDYYEQIVKRLRPNGVILVDNVLFHGSVIDPGATDDSAQGIRDFNDHVIADERVDCVMLAIGDGLTFIRRR
jgi:caffeoyl-CoA O-methyltransferase